MNTRIGVLVGVWILCAMAAIICSVNEVSIVWMKTLAAIFLALPAGGCAALAPQFNHWVEKVILACGASAFGLLSATIVCGSSLPIWPAAISGVAAYFFLFPGTTDQRRTFWRLIPLALVPAAWINWGFWLSISPPGTQALAGAIAITAGYGCVGLIHLGYFLGKEAKQATHGAEKVFLELSSMTMFGIVITLASAAATLAWVGSTVHWWTPLGACWRLGLFVFTGLGTWIVHDLTSDDSWLLGLWKAASLVSVQQDVSD